MGKSTLIQWLVVALAAPVPSPEAARFGRAIPFPIILRDIISSLGNDHSKWTWQSLLRAFLAHKAGGSDTDAAIAAPLAEDTSMLDTVLHSPQAWFLLDGLDEIGDPKRRRALQIMIWEGFKLYPNARWLITSRVVGYEEAEVHRELELFSPVPVTKLIKPLDTRHVDTSGPMPEGPEEYFVERGKDTIRITILARLLHLAPWDDTQQRDFAHHWFTQRLGEAEGADRAEKFITDVRAHASTKVLGRVPNLLLLMALLYRYRAHLPHGRALVYAGISNA